MAKSILQSERECYICGTTYGLDEHHVIHGTSNRAQSEKNGLKVWLCRDHHNMVHMNRAEDLKLIKMAQRKFEETHSREEFREIFGKSYL